MTRAVLMLLLATAPTAAQQVPQNLSLEQAQEIARLHNPDYLKVQNDGDVADAAVRQGYGRFMPSLSTSLSFNGSNSSTLTGEDEFGRPVSELRRVESERSSTTQQVSLGLTLFDGGATLRQLGAAKAGQRETDARIALAANRLRAQVARDYYGALRAEQLIALEERLLAARRDDLERTEKLLAVAASKYIDVLSARVDVANAEQSLDLARGNAQKSRLMLAQTIGVGGAAPFTLASSAPEIFDPRSLDVDAMVRQALAESPVVVQARAALDASEKRTSVARGARWPTIRGNAGFNRGTSLSGYNAFSELNPQNRSFGFGLSFSLPLFDGFSTSAQIAQASAAESDAREDVRAQRMLVEREVRSAFIDLNNFFRAAQLAEQRAELSRERLTAAQEEFRLGALQFFQLQQYVDQAARAERDLLDARFNFINGLIALEEKIGAPVER